MEEGGGEARLETDVWDRATRVLGGGRVEVNQGRAQVLVCLDCLCRAKWASRF